MTTTPDALVDQVWIEGRKGSLQPELLAATRRSGRLPLRLEPTLTQLKASLRAGYPPLVLLNLGPRWLPIWHYAVVVAATDDVWVLRSGTTRRRGMSEAEFRRSWERADQWAFVVAHPGHVPPMAQPHQWVRAAADLLQIGQVDAGLLALQQATRQWPASRLTWFALGNAQADQGDWAAAHASLEQSVAVDPLWLPAVNNLVSTLVRLDCPSQAAPWIPQLEASSAAYAQQTVAEYAQVQPGAACQLSP